MEKDIVKWLNEQPAWVRYATELFIKSGAISDSQIKQLTDICVSEARGEDCSKYQVQQSSLLTLDGSKGFSVTKISEVTGVNAIATDRPLVFLKNGINVIYGANGAGKSGYIRILKMISGAIYREEIKSNIYQAKKKKPSCTIDIVEDNTEMQFNCNLTVPGQFEKLRKIDIFDTKTAQGYIGDEKEAAFEPWIFELFRVLGEVAVAIKNELVRRKDSIVLLPYEVPDSHKNAVGIVRLSELTGKAKGEDFAILFTEEDEKVLEDLKQKSQIEKNELIIRLKERQIGELNELITYFKSFGEFYGEDNWTRITLLTAEWREKKSAFELARTLLESNLDDIDKMCNKGTAWLELWKAARKVFAQTKKENEADFTEQGGICPLCHQKIEDDTYLRMSSIDEYVNGEIAKAEAESRKKYLEKIVHPRTKTEQEVITRLGEFADTLGDAIKEINVVLVQNENRISKIETEPVSIEYVNVEDILNKIMAVVKVLQTEKDELVKLNASDDQKELQQQIFLLQEKKIIADNYSGIKENIDRLKQIDILDNAIKKTSTNRITAKSRELAQLLITDAYIERFNVELSRLSASGLTAVMTQGKGRKGKIPYKVQLCDADGNYVSPKDILSEGECRAVALAAFFAEAAGRAEECPLIVDDPISSLDYEYEGRVISRLVDAAKNRQVIVFTHRISVVVGIYEAANKRGDIVFNEMSIRALPGRKGIPCAPDVYAGKSDKQLAVLLNEKIPQLKKTDELLEEYIERKHYICQQFRNCLEKGVEEFLIGEVVARFRRDVQTRRIKCLPSITQDDCDLVESLMTKYSYYDHSMALEAPLIEFTVDEIEEDIKSFSDWVKVRKRLLN